MHVYLLPKLIPTDPAKTLAASWIPDLQRSRDDWKRMLQDHQKSTKYGFMKNDSEDKDYQERIARDEADLGHAKSFQSSPPQMDALAIYQELHGHGSIAPAFISNSVQEVTTSVDGKFQLSHIPAGDWYVFAIIHTSTTLVEWIIPLHITSDKNTPLDLFNDNATVVDEL